MSLKKIKPVNTIYQYCSLQTFMAMIENNEIWCSNILKMNDSAEEKYLEFILKKYSSKIRMELIKSKKYKKMMELKENSENKNLTKVEKIEKLHQCKLLKKNLNQSDKELIKLLNQIEKKIIINSFLKKNLIDVNRYISCFSEEGDILSQWRAYADDGNGLSVGFNLKKLKEIFKNMEMMKEELKNEILEINLVKVEYIKIKENYKSEVKRLCKYYPKINDIDNDMELDQLIEDTMYYDSDQKIFINLEVFFRKLIDLCLERIGKNIKELDVSSLERMKKLSQIKNFQFNEEKEQRLVIIDNIKEERKTSELELSKILFRKNKDNNDLIKYKKIKFLKNKIIDLIDCIYIGPKNKITEEEIIEFLKLEKTQNKIKIEKSTATYI